MNLDLFIWISWLMAHARREGKFSDAIESLIGQFYLRVWDVLDSVVLLLLF